MLLFALVLAVIGQNSDEVLNVISLITADLGLALAFWDGIAALWRKLTAEPADKKDEE
jgi:hypothetical protein